METNDLVQSLVEELRLAHQRNLQIYDKAYEDMKAVANQFAEFAFANVRVVNAPIPENPDSGDDDSDPGITGGM